MCDVSVIIPVFNGEKWIDACFQSVAEQTCYKILEIEIIVFNDGSTDKTEEMLTEWQQFFLKRDISFHIIRSATSVGVGAAKNCAIKNSVGQYLCFQDIDDTMHPNRILLQWETSKNNHNALVGSRVIREPANSTPRFVNWANNLTYQQLKLQIYTSNGPTLLMPTWFCHRSVYDRVGGFVEAKCGTPEDLIFFHSHLDRGGDLYMVKEPLVIYTYHKNATTFSVLRETIWKIQLKRLEKEVLPHWNYFTIWNAGKAGKALVRSLSPDNLKKVVAFCDVNKKKIGHMVELYCPIKRTVDIKLPVVHFQDAKTPLIICVKLNLTNGEFEKNLESLNLTEGKDYIMFS